MLHFINCLLLILQVPNRHFVHFPLFTLFSITQIS